MAVPVYYTMLGVPAGATQQQIDWAFERLAAQVHRAAHQGDRLAARRYQALVEAYTVLGDPASRAAYDAYLSVQEVSARPRTADAGVEVRPVDGAERQESVAGEKQGGVGNSLPHRRGVFRSRRRLWYGAAAASVLLLCTIGAGRPGRGREGAVEAPSNAAGYIVFALPGAVLAAPSSSTTVGISGQRAPQQAAHHSTPATDHPLSAIAQPEVLRAPLLVARHPGLAPASVSAVAVSHLDGGGEQNPPRSGQLSEFGSGFPGGSGDADAIGHFTVEGRYPAEFRAPRCLCQLSTLQAPTMRAAVKRPVRFDWSLARPPRSGQVAPRTNGHAGASH